MPVMHGYAVLRQQGKKQSQAMALRCGLVKLQHHEPNRQANYAIAR